MNIIKKLLSIFKKEKKKVIPFNNHDCAIGIMYINQKINELEARKTKCDLNTQEKDCILSIEQDILSLINTVDLLENLTNKRR